MEKQHPGYSLADVRSAIPRKVRCEKKNKGEPGGWRFGAVPCQLCLHPPPCPDLLGLSLRAPWEQRPDAGWLGAAPPPASGRSRPWSRVCRAVEQGSAGGIAGTFLPGLGPSVLPASPAAALAGPPQGSPRGGVCGVSVPRVHAPPKGRRAGGRASSSPALDIRKSPGFNPAPPASGGRGKKKNKWGEKKIKRQIQQGKAGATRSRACRPLRRRGRAARRPRKPPRARRGAAHPAWPPPGPAAPPAGPRRERVSPCSGGRGPPCPARPRPHPPPPPRPPPGRGARLCGRDNRGAGRAPRKPARPGDGWRGVRGSGVPEPGDGAVTGSGRAGLGGWKRRGGRRRRGAMPLSEPSPPLC